MEAARRGRGIHKPGDPIVVSENEKSNVVHLKEALERSRPTARAKAYLQSPDGERVELPAPMFEVLLRAAQDMALGNAVAIVSVQHELTTQQAADLLNVSRPHLIKLLESGNVPYHKAGTHRRLLFADVMAYREFRDRERHAALVRLTAASQEMGLEY